MRNILLAGATLLVLTSSGYAFTKPAPMTLDTITNLECVTTYEEPRTYERNPIYKIQVTLTLTENGDDVESLDAVHVAANGDQYDRNDQYTDSNVWKKKGVLEWYWTGTRNRDSRIKMGGRLYYNNVEGWVYQEDQTKNGQQKYFMTSKCHPV
jgi:hypothetical protein